MKSKLFGTSMVVLATALAAPAAFAADTTVQEVIVTGTRTTGVKAANSAAPIQVVGSAALTKTGATDLAIALTSAVPSLNINTTGGDMAALSIQAALRGLSPNDTLVLIDGKRRHDTSNLGVDGGSPYSGSATTDLSFIPVGAIDHVEVLTDGAAAQYGSDAIAGVVNIILKKSGDGGQIVGTGSQYYSGQGLGGSWSVNKGFGLGDKGYVNVTLEERDQTYTYDGIGDFRFQNPDGSEISGLGSPNSNVGSSQNFPHENRVTGTPAYNIYNAEYNAAYALSNEAELYSFGTFGYRDAEHYENYRAPNKVWGCEGTATGGGGVTPGVQNPNGSTSCTSGTLVYPFPQGFDPQEAIRETDFSFTGGVRGTVVGWRYDLSTTYGEDNNQIYVLGSANAQLYPVLQALSTTPIAPQTDFYDGAFVSKEWTTTLDLDKDFAVGLASPLNVAFGGEFRKDSFTTDEGEPSAYYGGGAQSFDGYTPLDQGTHTRTNYAGYIDLAVDPVTGLHTDIAGRYEHYSDFGDATVGKFTARYDFNPMFAIRGTASTGFRAPTLAEEYYSGTNVSPTSADVQLPPNSTAAQLAGFQPLKPEKSTNFSLGFVAHPADHLQITADVYDIKLSNRITVTGFVFGTLGPSTVSQGVLNAIAARGVHLDSGLSYTGISVFTNAATTTTTGLDVTANYASDFEEFGHVDWTLGFNYNHTAIDSINALPSAVTVAPGQPNYALAASLGQAAGDPILNASAASALTTETPQEKVIFQALWGLDKWSVNGRVTVYGPTSATEVLNVNQETFKEEIGTTPIFDLDVGYKLTKNLKLDVGANNLFNTIPPKAPLVDGRPADNGLVYGVPYGFAPWGVTGGLYYGRFTYTF
jgi:iron complex outermembrane receptor protein